MHMHFLFIKSKAAHRLPNRKQPMTPFKWGSSVCLEAACPYECHKWPRLRMLIHKQFCVIHLPGKRGYKSFWQDYGTHVNICCLKSALCRWYTDWILKSNLSCNFCHAVLLCVVFPHCHSLLRVQHFNPVHCWSRVREPFPHLEQQRGPEVTGTSTLKWPLESCGRDTHTPNMYTHTHRERKKQRLQLSVIQTHVFSASQPSGILGWQDDEGAIVVVFYTQSNWLWLKSLQGWWM